jgi:predicted anti-sigma-YlaC factor YlaD
MANQVQAANVASIAGPTLTQCENQADSQAQPQTRQIRYVRSKRWALAAAALLLLIISLSVINRKPAKMGLR